MGAGDYDVAKADELGFSIKLLGISSQTDSGAVLQRVHPAMIPKTTALGSTHGVINGLFTMGDFVGPTRKKYFKFLADDLEAVRLLIMGS